MLAPVGEHRTENREVEPHEVPPEIEYVELRNEEAEDLEMKKQKIKSTLI